MSGQVAPGRRHCAGTPRWRRRPRARAASTAATAAAAAGGAAVATRGGSGVLAAALVAAAPASSQSFGLAIASKGLSVAVVGGSFVGKLPQVRAIWLARSRNGLSLVSIWTETVSMGIQFAYNVVRRTPLSTYAEVPVLFCQLLLLTVVAAWADGALGARVWAACLGVVAATAAMAVEAVPVGVTMAMYAANASLSLLIVLPQVHANWRNRSTGQLSLVVTGMTFSGTTTRLFTTFVEVDDVALCATISLNWLLTGLLLLQFWVYRESSVVEEGPTKVAASVTSSLAAVSRPHSLKHAMTLGSLRTPGLKSKAQFVAGSMAAFGSSCCLLDLVDNDEFEQLFVKKISAIRPVQSMSALVDFENAAFGRRGFDMGLPPSDIIQKRASAPQFGRA